MPLKTQLNDYHVSHGRIVDFAGFEMPIWYKGIVPESLAVRNRVGIFDVSHMGRAIVQGANAETFLNFVTTNDVTALKPGQAHYTLLCNENGGIKDDIIILRLESERFVSRLQRRQQEERHGMAEDTSDTKQCISNG